MMDRNRKGEIRIFAVLLAMFISFGALIGLASTDFPDIPDDIGIDGPQEIDACSPMMGSEIARFGDLEDGQSIEAQAWNPVSGFYSDSFFDQNIQFYDLAGEPTVASGEGFSWGIDEYGGPDNIWAYRQFAPAQTGIDEIHIYLENFVDDAPLLIQIYEDAEWEEQIFSDSVHGEGWNSIEIDENIEVGPDQAIHPVFSIDHPPASPAQDPIVQSMIIEAEEFESDIGIGDRVSCFSSLMGQISQSAFYSSGYALVDFVLLPFQILLLIVLILLIARVVPVFGD